jgi:DNA modification methylase
MLLINGDCIKEMQKLIDDGVQVDSVVTDPPYELGFMGKSWDSTGIAFNPKTWELALKLLKPGGYLVGFSASRNYHRMAVAIEDAGFEIRDQIMWLYGSGFPKSLNVGKAIDKRNGVQGDVIGTRKVTSSDIGQKSGWNHLNTDRGDYEYREIMNEYEGWGTALKPAHEPIVMARKPLSEKSIVDNVLKHGTGAINIDGCRIEGNEANGAERKTANRKSRSEDGVWTDNNSGMKQEDNHFADADPRGRFPANVMHDGSDVITKEFPQTGKSGSVKPIDKQKTNDVFGKYNEVKEFQAYDDEGSAARFFYCPKTSSAERNRGLENFTAKPIAWGNQAKAELKRGNLDFAADGDGTKHNKVSMRLNTHPTVKPVELMKYLCRLVTPKGGIVLDPFMGSGSTGMAAKDEGFDFIGIEKDEEYFKICESRIKTTSPLMDFM